MADYNYPEDEFDRLAKDREVLGAHREVKPERKWLYATIAIIVIVPLMAWGFVRIGGAHSVANKVTGAPGAAATDAQGNGQAGSTGNDGTSPEGGQQTDENVNVSIEIRVLNGSGISGLAAKKEKILAEAGFTYTTAANYTGGSTPEKSTIYYAKEEDAATAQKAASALGISEVVMSAQAVSGGEGIVVVLRSDAV